MKRPTSLTAAIATACVGLAIIGLVSCSETPRTYLIRHDNTPAGKIVEYKLESNRVGSLYLNDELKEDFDRQIEAEVIYEIQEVLDNGVAVILEKNKWSWDEAAGDTGQVKRKTKEYAFSLKMTPKGKVIDFKSLADSPPTHQAYSAAYYEQGMPVFPDKAVPIGYSWTQTTTTSLPDGSTEEASTTYKVKGTARTMGYDCIIIEYKGNLTIPLFKDPSDTTALEGVDRSKMSGILYFALDAGSAVKSEERRRMASERNYIKGGKPMHRLMEFEEVISYYLVGLSNP